jgi:hypothetical protein
VKLPDQESMMRAIEADHAWAAKQFPDSPRYGLKLDPRRYRSLLARDYARNGVTRRPTAPAVVQPSRAA